MFINNLKTSEKLALVVASIVFVIALVFIFDDSIIYRHFVSTESRGFALGKISYQDNDARRKKDTRLTWLPVDEGDQLYSKDQIFTGNNSNLVIDGNDGNQYLIGENSLVKVYEIEQKIALDIGFGDIKLNLKPNTEVLISKDNKITKFKAGDKGANITILGSGKLLDVKVDEGKVALDDGKKKKELTPKQIQTINPDEIEIKLVGTFLNKVLAPQSFDKTNKLFEWTSNHNFDAYDIIWSYDEQFKNVIYKTSSVNNKVWDNKVLTFNRDEKIFWKVIAKLDKTKFTTNKEYIESDSANFVLSSNKPPILIFPTANFRLAVEDANSQPPQVHFSFSPQTPLKYYEVEVASTPNFESPLQKLITKKSPIISDVLYPGKYFWRVKGVIDGDNKNSIISSSVASFTVVATQPKKLDTPASPNSERWFELASLTEGKSHKQVQAMSAQNQLALSDNFPVLAASEEVKPISHDFQISNNKDFANPILQATSSTTHFTWKSPRLGEYLFRVRTVDGIAKSDYSASTVFGVKLFPPISTTAISFDHEVSDLADAKQNSLNVPITWNPTILTAKYELVVSTDSNFLKNSTSHIVQDNKFNYQTQSTGSYFWKVRSLNSKNEPISDFSQTFSFKFQKEFNDKQMIRAFRQIFPEHTETLFVLGKGKNIVRFRWSTPFPKNTKFQVQLAKNAEFNDLLINAASDSNYHDHKKHLPAGQYFWRIRAKMGDIVTDWTPVANFQIVEQKSVNFASNNALSYLKSINADKGFSETDRSIANAFTISDAIKPPSISNYAITQIEKLSGGNLYKLNWEELSQLNASQLLPYTVWPNLTWSEVSGADNYTLEISVDEAFKKLVLRKDLNTNEFNWLNSTTGIYYYRVSASKSGVGISKPSETRKLIITNHEPILINPVQRVEWKNALNKNKQNSAFSLNWTPIPNAASYRLELSKFSDMLDKRVLRSVTNSYKISFSNSGLHYIRLVALDKYGHQLSATSEVFPLDNYVADQPVFSAGKITTTSPFDNSLVTLSSYESNNIGFEWLNGTNAKEFVIQVSKNANFESVELSGKTDKSDYVFRHKLNNGKYYWRVGANNANGSISWSEVKSFNAIKLQPYSLNRSLSSQK